MANIANLSDQQIRDRLANNIYPRIAELMQVEQEEIAGKWVVILNFLLAPKTGYKLNPAPQLNSDNFQGSFGRQIFFIHLIKRLFSFRLKGHNFINKDFTTKP
jgi:hypothetical protein